MQSWKTAVVAAGVVAFILVFSGCGDRSDPWLDADLESALEEAGERGTLVMVDFKTEWCTWCKRLDRDTFSDPEVITELEELVALQLDAEKEGVDAAEKYGIRSFPTIVFLDAAGHEIDRILGYMPPDAFLAEVQRIRAGDTFNACLARLNEDPSDLEALGRENQAAIAMAQEAYDVDREPGVGDTLARLLYVDGKVDEAIEIETRAADGSDGRSAEEFAAVVEMMRSGEDLGDRPSFEDFPGEKRG